MRTPSAAENTHINGVCKPRQLYRFSYDGANRLSAAAHREWNGSAWTDLVRYNESGITYDLNGNLKTYIRQGLITTPSSYGTIDNLNYYYDDSARPDRLTRVTDAGNNAKGFVYNASATTPHYAYDANGNLTQDKHKNLNLITYNYLNLPQSFALSGGTITMSYSADGEKLSKTVGSTVKNYVAGIEYTGANLEAIYHAEGRLTPNGSNFYYEYTLKDHLGNARVNFRANGTAVTFLEETHYYPFGLQMEGLSTTPVTVNAYKYNSKEWNNDFGLGLYDYGARWYDPALGRWWSVDPMGEKYLNFTSYCYGGNNPVLIIDPNGMELYIKINAYYGQAINDIISLVNNAKFSGKVSINFTTKDGDKKDKDVKAEVNFIGISQETVDNDKGLSLLDNLSKSDKKFLYEVNTIGDGIDRVSNSETPEYKLGTPTQKGGMVLNLSQTDRGDSPKYNTKEFSERHRVFNSNPKDGYDAHVIISPYAGDAKQSEKGSKIPRGWFTFHELNESFNRTDKGLNYIQSHKNAISDGKSFYLTPRGWDQTVVNPYAESTTLRKIREGEKKE